MEVNRTLHVIGASMGLGSILPGSEDGPIVLKASEFLPKPGLLLDWQTIINPTNLAQSAELQIADCCQRIAQYTRAFTRTKQFFLMVGGDNTCSIGTWSGAQASIADQGTLGMIWIDAHLDSHTPETTETGCLNGMPLAALMGYGNPLFTRVVHPEPKLLPQYVCHIGARSYEKGEHALLHKLGVKTFYSEEVHQRGIEKVLQEALQIVKTGTAAYGICIDLDILDPEEAPGVGNREPQGLQNKNLCRALAKLAFDPKLIGFEVVELNPGRDQDRRTERAACDIIAAVALGVEN